MNETAVRRAYWLECKKAVLKRTSSIVLTLLCLILLHICPGFADQTQIPNYRKARDLHWEQLYPRGGWTLYCGERFENRTGCPSSTSTRPA